MISICKSVTKFIVCIAMTAWLCSAWNAAGGQGDVVSITILPDGWMAQVEIAGMATNGVYSFGLNPSPLTNGSPNFLSPNGSSFEINLTDMGFDDNGQPTAVQRTVVGTKACRIPYQGAASDGSGDTSANGNTLHTWCFMESTNSDTGTITVTIALSDRILARSSNLTANVQAGFYTSAGVGNNAAVAIPVVNNSTVQYPKVIGAWSDVPFRVVQGPRYRLRLVAFHYFAQQGRQVRAVKFWGVCGSRTNQAVWATQMVRSDLPDPTPVLEYVADMDNTPFNKLDTVTNYATIYPWIGDDSSVLDATGMAPIAFSTNDWGALTSFVSIADPDSSLQSSFAVVDATNGSPNGIVVTNAYNSSPEDALQGAVPFADIGQALNAIRATNGLVFGATRSNWSFATIFLTNGFYANVGSAVLLANASPGWFQIAAHPDAGRENVIIGSNTGQSSLLQDCKIHVTNVTIKLPDSGPFTLWGKTGPSAFWLDSCNIISNANGNASILKLSSVNAYATWNDLGQYKVGFRPNLSGGAIYDKWKLVRGNHFTNQCNAIPNCFIGNLISPPTNMGGSIQNDLSAQTAIQFGDVANPFIIAFNRFYNQDATAQRIGTTKGFYKTINVVIAQNLFEGVNGNYPAFDIGQGATYDEAITNCLIINNTMLCLYHEPHNFETNQPAYIEHFRNLLNIFSLKESTFDTGIGGSGQQNGVRTNRWAIMYGVGNIGNSWARQIVVKPAREAESIGATGNYGFRGLNTLYFGDQTVADLSAFKFVDCEANLSGSTSVANGYGDYHLMTNSLLQNAAYGNPWLLPFDLDGNPRTPFDPPGAYASSISPPVLAITNTGDHIVISWAANYLLQSSSTVSGPYSTIAGATNPYVFKFETNQQFFRLNK